MVPVKRNGVMNRIGGATVGTGVTVVLVAIITGFNTGLDMTVAASGCGAIVETGVGLGLVGVITILNASLDMPVTA